MEGYIFSDRDYLKIIESLALEKKSHYRGAMITMLATSNN